MQTYSNFIGGKFLPSSGSQDRIEITNQSTGQAIGAVPEGSLANVDMALASAEAAQESWAALPAVERGRVLRAIAAKIRENVEALARTITEEQDKILDLSRIEVSFTADYFDYMAEWARRMEGEILESDRPREMILLFRRPIGVVGSVETGSAIMGAAAEHITKVNLELGGKAPAIMMADADLDLATRAIKASRIINSGNSGQVCNCAERVYVHSSIANEFTDKLALSMKSSRFGNPVEDESVEYGPLINEAAFRKVDGLVHSAIKEGASLVTGGRRGMPNSGYFYEPTVLAGCRQEMEIVRREIFGPVIPVVTFDDLDQAIHYANDSDYGLTSSIYTRDLNAALEACQRIRFGETYINREKFEAMQAFHAGWRKSGIGGADGKHGFYEFMQTPVVYLQRS